MTNCAARRVNSGVTQRGGLRWMLVLPLKSPNTRCISGASLWRGRPFLSVPTELILTAFFSSRLLTLPFTSTK